MTNWLPVGILLCGLTCAGPVSAEDENPVLDAENVGGGVPVLTAEDMERLRRERADEIRRGTPLGEEADKVDELRRR